MLNEGEKNLQSTRKNYMSRFKDTQAFKCEPVELLEKHDSSMKHKS